MHKSYKSAGSIIMGLAILAVAYFGVYRFYGEMNDTRALKAASQTENDRLNKALDDIQTFVSEYNTNLDQATLAEKALPVGDADVAELLDYYSKMAQAGGLALISMNMEDTTDQNAAAPENSIQTMDWNMEVSGSYEALKDYLMRIRQGLRLTDVISMSVDHADSEQKDGRTLNVVLKMRTYYQK